MDPRDSDIEDLPQALIDDLEARDRGMTLLTARVDRHIEAQAFAQFSARRKRRRVPRAAWAALAASLLVAILVLDRNPIDDDMGHEIYADLDGSGRIDIADVLHLARQRERLSQEEINAFAMKVVSLSSWEKAS